MPKQLEALPPEIIVQVFHHGCVVSKQFSLSLCLVSSWSRSLALPYLYAAVVLENQSTISTFYRTVAKSEIGSDVLPPARLYVRGLWIEPISNVVVDIFGACENLEYISIREENLLWLIRAPLNQSPNSHLASSPETPRTSTKDFHLWVTKGRTNRWTLYAPVDLITTPVLPSLFLAKITHLVLNCATGYKILRNIKNFVRLAHLAVAYDGSPSQNLEELAEAVRLAPVHSISCVLILVVDVLPAFRCAAVLSWVASLDISQRIHVLPSRYEDLRGQWKEELRTGMDVWKKAALNPSTIITLSSPGGR